MPIDNRIPKRDTWRSVEKAIKALPQGIRVGMPAVQSNLNNGGMVHKEVAAHLKRIANQAQHPELVKWRRETVAGPDQEIMGAFCQ